MTKKLLSILLCVTMILTSFVTIGFADDETAYLVFGELQMTGDEIKLPVTLNGSAGLDKISSITMNYGYDKTKLTYKGVDSGLMTFDSDSLSADGKISWFANSPTRNAVDAAEVTGALFTLVFEKIAGATGTAEVRVSDGAEISSDSAVKKANHSMAVKNIELTPPEIAFGAADKKDSGEIHIPVSLSTIPEDIAAISAFTLEYTYDKSVLEYVRTDDGVLTAAEAKGDYAADGKISFVTESEIGVADNSLFTLVFKVKDAAFSGTTEVKPTFAELGSKLGDHRSDLVLKGTTVDLTPSAVVKPKVEVVPTQSADGTIEFAVSVDRVPNSFNKKLNSFDMEYTYDAEKFAYVGTTSDILSLNDKTIGGKISWYDASGVTIDGKTTLAVIKLKSKDCENEGTFKLGVADGKVELGCGTLPATQYDNNVDISSADFTLAKKSHTWGDWDIVTAPTYETDGLRKHTCSVCGKEESEIISKLTAKLDKISASVTSFDIPWVTFNNGEDAVKAYVKTLEYTITAAMTDNSTKTVTASAEVVVDMTAKTVKFTYTEGEITKETAALTLNIGEAPLASIEVVPAAIDIPFADYNAGSTSIEAFIAGKYTVNATLADGTVITGVTDVTAAANPEQKKVYVSYTRAGETKTAEITLNVGAPLLTKITAKKADAVVESIDYCVADVAKIKAYIEAQGIKVYGTYEDNTETEVAAVLTVDTTDKAVYTFEGKTAEIAINIVEHNWVSQSRTEPTETADGSEVFKCSRCDETKTVILPKLNAEVDTITAEPATVDVPYSAWNDTNAPAKIAEVIKNKVNLKAKMTDGAEYSDLINEATITVDTDAKKATIEYGGKSIEIALNFEPDPSAAIESISAVPASITLAYTEWYGKTAAQLADFVKAYSGFKVTATKVDGTTVDVTDDADVTVTVGSNLTGTATVTYDGKTTTIALAFVPSSSSGGGNNRRPGGGGSSIFVPVTPTPSDDSIFKDLPKDHFAYDAIMALYKRGVVSGDGNNYIYPENGITREEIAKIALTVNQITEETGLEIDAADKDSVSPWAANIVATAMKKGILVGYGDGTIRPKQLVTREEMVAMFVRALGVQADSKDTKFSDVSQEAWSAAYVAAAADLGFVNGYEDGTFRPANNITRAEAFVICNRIMQFRDTLTAAIAG